MPEPREIALRVGADLQAVAVSADAANLMFYAAKAFPPGQPLQLTLWPDSAEALLLHVRTIGSRLRADGQFEVRTRLVNLSRDARTKLLTTFG